MLERDLVKKIKDLFELRYKCMVFKHHGSPFSHVGHPDLYGFTPQGQAWFLEVKVPGKEPTAAQNLMIGAINKNGGYAGWVDNLQDAEAFMRSFIASY